MELALKLTRLAVVLTLALLLLNTVGCVAYRALLFQRDTAPLAGLRAAAAREQLRLWPEDGPAYQGLVGLTSNGPAKGTIVIFHGNAGMALHRTYYTAALERLGYRVVLAEYPGYGARGGRLTEKALVRDGLATSERALADFGAPLFIWGESMGCAVAAGVAAELKGRIKGLILLTPWNNLPDLAAFHYPRWLAKLLVRERFDNAASLRRYAGPAAFLIAGQDEVVPAPQAQALYDGYTGPKRLWAFPRSNHNTWPSSPVEPWWEQVMLFLAADNPG